MLNDNSTQSGLQKMRPNQEDEIDFKKIYSSVVSNWRYFLISMVAALICASIYITCTIPTYSVSATILINEEKKTDSLGNDQLLEGFGLGGGSKNLDNQIMVLTSRTLIGRALDDLPFDIEYYQRRLFNKIALYPNCPFKIVSEKEDSLPRDIEFTFKYLDNSKFSIDAKSNDSFVLHKQALFGEIIKTPSGNFRVELSNGNWPVKNLDHKIQLIFHSRKKLIESYRKRIRVEKVSKTGTILKLNLEGTNKAMDIEFLNKLTEIFLNNSLDKKNLEAIRTIQFIDDQLIGITDSLVITENKLQKFRSANKVMNLSAQGQVIIDQAMSLENQKARLGIEANYYDYLVEYLAKDNAGQVPIAPATMGITDPGLTKLVADLAEQQGQFYSKSLGEKNPLQSQLAQKVRNIKESLKEILNGVKRSNNLAMSEISAQIRTVNAQASALPVTERQLLGIERKYKLNDQLYTFLLEKRAGAQIQKASNMPDNEVVDPSEPDIKPVKPKTALIYLLAVLAGTGFPFLWILVADTFNYKVREDEDIKKITDIPINGHIPHSQLKKNIIMFEEPSSNVAEAFRSLRSRMQFFIKEAKAPIILITSSMPEEGKTFTAINLASVYSLMGKKTVLVGFDLRKPKIFTDFSLENDHGVSTWLIGKDSFEDIIKKTQYENMDIILAGPVPPNPSELMALEKTEELLKILKKKYECIIIDSAPIGTVSDTFHIAALVDTCILIVRQNITLKDQLENTVKELKFSDIKSLSVVVNDLGSEYKRYGYGGKYGYHYEKVKSKK
jgi:capsular exopolysaccharide synthesis family protein